MKENRNMEKILKDNEKNMSKAISAAQLHIVHQICWTVCPVLGGAEGGHFSWISCNPKHPLPTWALVLTDGM